MADTHQACAVCGLIVNLRTYPDGREEWIHANAPDDHPVVRVDWTEVQTNVRCDFCLADHALWTLPVEDYIADPEAVNVGNWAACAECAALLKVDDWKTLTDRSWKEFVRRNGPAPREAFRLLYEQLRPHIIGEVDIRPL